MPDIFRYFLPLLQTGQRGDHGKMWRSVRAFQPTGSSLPFPDIQVFKPYHMYAPNAQTTQGFPPTFQATVNWVLSRHTRVFPGRRAASNDGENDRHNVRFLLIPIVSSYLWSAGPKTCWLRIRVEEMRRDLMVTSCNIYSAPMEADGSFL